MENKEPFAYKDVEKHSMQPAYHEEKYIKRHTCSLLCNQKNCDTALFHGK